MVEHGFLVLPADATEVAQEATTAGHHLREGDLLRTNPKNRQKSFLLENIFSIKNSNCVFMLS